LQIANAKLNCRFEKLNGNQYCFKEEICAIGNCNEKVKKSHLKKVQPFRRKLINSPSSVNFKLVQRCEACVSVVCVQASADIKKMDGTSLDYSLQTLLALQGRSA
jgi:hypothetical protein